MISDVLCPAITAIVLNHNEKSWIAGSLGWRYDLRLSTWERLLTEYGYHSNPRWLPQQDMGKTLKVAECL